MEADKVEKQKELQRAFMESEAYRGQLEELMGQMRLVEARKLEIASTIEAIDSLKNVEPGTEILVPLGSEAFMRAEVKDAGKIIVGVGAGVSLEKGLDEAKEALNHKIEKMSEAENNIQRALSEVRARLVQIDSSSKRLLEELQA